MKVLKSRSIFIAKFYLLSAISTLVFTLFVPCDFGLMPYSVSICAVIWNLFGVALCVLNPGWLFVVKISRRADIPFSLVLAGGLSSNLIFLCAATILIKIWGKPVSLHYIKLALFVFWLVCVFMPPLNLSHKRVEFKRESFIGVVAALVFFSIVIMAKPYRAVIVRGEERVISTLDNVSSKPCTGVELVKSYGFIQSGHELFLQVDDGLICVTGGANCLDGVLIGSSGSEVDIIDSFSLYRHTVEIPDELNVTTKFPGLPEESWRFPAYSANFPTSFRFEFPQMAERPKIRCVRFIHDSGKDGLVVILGQGDEDSRVRYLKRSFWVFSSGEMVDWFFNLRDQRLAFAPNLDFWHYSQPFWGFYITSIVREVTHSRVWGSQLFITLLFAIFIFVCVDSCAKRRLAFSIFYLGLVVWFVTLVIYFWMNPYIQLDVVLGTFLVFALFSLLNSRPMEFVASSVIACGNRIAGSFTTFLVALGYLIYDGHIRKNLRRFFIPYMVVLVAIFAVFFGYLFLKESAYNVLRMFWFEIFPEHFFRGTNRLDALFNAFVNFNLMTFGIWLLLLFLPMRSLLLMVPMCALYLPVLLLVDVPHFRYYLPFAMLFAFVLARFGYEKKPLALTVSLLGVTMLVVSFALIFSDYDIPFYLFGDGGG